jgi:uncharacterized membrane protein YozB (DUF420 family)
MRRSAARTRAALRLLASIAAFAIVFAVIFFIGMLLSTLTDIIDKPLSAILSAGALFSVFGALYGTIAVLDESSAFRGRFGSIVRTYHFPKVRAALGALWGIFAVLLATHLVDKSASMAALAIAASIGALLGWYGWRWAKYVDF